MWDMGKYEHFVFCYLVRIGVKAMVRRKRKENKGFSLLEVVIAVAVLTLLMAPIITQVIQTLSVSSAAKERQYAIENAEYVLNTVQETSTARLQLLNKSFTEPDGLKSIGDIKVDAIQPIKGAVNAHVIPHTYSDIDSYLARSSVSISDIEKCVASPNAVSGESGTESSEESSNYIPELNLKYAYDATIYTLKTEPLGKKKNEYSRKVIMDNLRAKLAENKLSVETKFDEGVINLLTDKGEVKGWGYTLTTEGALVKYDSNGLVTDVIVSEVTGLRNPNGMGTSYMQDLDSDKVAIITGAASNFDLQAENDLYNLKMNRLKKDNPNGWSQAMTRVPDDDFTNILHTVDYWDNVSKMTKISIVSGIDPVKKIKYYEVNCVVYYEDYMVKSSSTSEEDDEEESTANNGPGCLSYNAFSKKFYTSQAPDIYFVYEPYVADGQNYARKDYILTYDGVNYDIGEKHSKLYIIKPRTCRIGGYATSSSTFLTKMKETASSPGVAVEIYVDCLKATGVANEPMPIYTNIDYANNFKLISMDLRNSTDGVQYEPNLTLYYNEPKSSKTGAIKDTDVYDYEKNEIKRKQYPMKINYDGEEIDSIQSIDKDVMFSDRVYTVTVQLDRLKPGTTTVDEGNSIRLTGAKGAD